jgi:hypothetical protein
VREEELLQVSTLVRPQFCSKGEAQTKLYLPRVCRCGWAPEGHEWCLTCTKYIIWHLEIRPVEDVEALGDGLESYAFGELEPAAQPQIERHGIKAVSRIATNSYGPEVASRN